MKNIYGETKNFSRSNGDDFNFVVGRMLDIDMDNVDLTLFHLIKKTQDILDSLPENEYLGIYLVSGSSYSVNNFWDDYFAWVIDKGFKVKWFVRGKLHFQNIGFLLSNNPVFILSGTTLMYDASRLNQVLKTLSQDRDLFQNFMTRYLELYKNYFILQLDFSELTFIGLKFNLS